MKNSKKIIVTIIVILLILLLAIGAVGAYIFLATDLLKSDKELFLGYFAQITAENGFLDTKVEEFNEKKKTNSYENNGEITAEMNISAGEEESEELMEKLVDMQENVNNLVIRFSGKVDTTNQLVNQDIEIDYGKGVVFPISYRQDSNKYGIQIEELSKKFIGIRNENLEQFLGQFAVEEDLTYAKVEGLTTTFDSVAEIVEQIEFKEEDINQLNQIYGTVLQEQLLDEYFSSAKTENEDIYILDLPGGQIKNIIIKMLETTKQNPLILNKINEAGAVIYPNEEPISATQMNQLIDEIIKGINEDEEIEIPNIKFTLVAKDKILKQIVIDCQGVKLTIEKTSTADSLNYKVNVDITEIINEETNPFMDESENTEPRQINIYFDSQYTGLSIMDKVQANYKVGYGLVDNDVTWKYDYKINTNTTFNNSINIEKLSDDETMFLNDYDKENVTAFLTKVGTKILEINKEQMEELGLKEEENPLIYSNPLTTIVGGLIVYNMAAETIDKVDFSAQEVTAHNEKFLVYNGSSRRGSEVNALLKTVLMSNLNATTNEENDKLVSVKGAVQLNTYDTAITSQADTSKLYTIIVNYDGPNGFVNSITVTEE